MYFVRWVDWAKGYPARGSSTVVTASHSRLRPDRRERPRRAAVKMAVSIAVGLAVSALPAPVRAQGPLREVPREVPIDRQVLILTRALAYDSSLKDRAGAELLIAVLGKPGISASEELARKMTKAFQALGNVKVQGLPVRATQLLFTTAAALATAVEAQGVDALYVCPGLETDLPALIEVTRQARVISMASREEQVEKGLSLGVFMIEAKPTMVVNLPASKAEGAAFGSDLLRLAKVLR